MTEDELRAAAKAMVPGRFYSAPCFPCVEYVGDAYVVSDKDGHRLVGTFKNDRGRIRLYSNWNEPFEEVLPEESGRCSVGHNECTLLTLRPEQEPTTSPVSGVQATEARGVRWEIAERWAHAIDTDLVLHAQGDTIGIIRANILHALQQAADLPGTGSRVGELSPPAAEIATSSSSKEPLSSSKEVREVLERLKKDLWEATSVWGSEPRNRVLSIINRYLEETK